MSRIAISLTVNGTPTELLAEPREQLADLLRGSLLLTGTHLGCEHGVCGACSVRVDGVVVRGCLMLAVQVDGADVVTIEGLTESEEIADLQEKFVERNALQCGYCTPGMLVAARDVVLRLPDADEARVREEMAGNLCRCTGYRGIVRAVLSVLAARQRATASE